MAASQQTRYYHGASPGTPSADVSGSTVRHKLADNDIQDTNNPIPIPLTGLSFGWRKSSKENWSTTPVSSISNLVWFMSSTPAVGQRVFARLQAPNVYVPASAGDTAGIVGFTDTPTNQNANDAINYTSGTPLTINAGTVLSNPNVGEGSQNFLETQMSFGVTYTGGAGPTVPLTVSYRYTEV